MRKVSAGPASECLHSSSAKSRRSCPRITSKLRHAPVHCRFRVPPPLQRRHPPLERLHLHFRCSPSAPLPSAPAQLEQNAPQAPLESHADRRPLRLRIRCSPSAAAPLPSAPAQLGRHVQEAPLESHGRKTRQYLHHYEHVPCVW